MSSKYHREQGEKTYEYGITAKSVEFKEDGRMILHKCLISYDGGEPIAVDYIVTYPLEEDS